MNDKDLVAAVVSLLALLFTVLSFWWMQWRPGNLAVGNGIRQYAVGRGTTGHKEKPN